MFGQNCRVGTGASLAVELAPCLVPALAFVPLEDGDRGELGDQGGVIASPTPGAPSVRAKSP
jgi:hypothetical protein